MRISLSIILIVLTLIFFFFYVTEVYLGSNLVKDLTANLFASMIVVVIIERIVRRSEMQKSERSIIHIKRRIANILIGLLYLMRPPDNWRERIESEDERWEDYFGRTILSRSEAFNKLETVLDSYHYLLAPNLRNDLMDVLDLLDSFAWVDVSSNTVSRFQLRSTVIYSTNVCDKAFVTIKEHNLLRDIARFLHWKKGEPAEVNLSWPWGVGPIQNLTSFKNFRDEAIRFRDMFLERTLREKAKKNVNEKAEKTKEPA